jgi:hypothetical protein
MLDWVNLSKKCAVGTHAANIFPAFQPVITITIQ